MKQALIFLALFFAVVGFSVASQNNTQKTQTVQKKPLAIKIRVMAAATTAPTTIDFTWQYIYTQPPTCPSNGTLSNCVIGFTLTDNTSGIVVATSAQLPITATTYAYTPAGGLFYGTHCYTMVTDGYDGNGNAIVSSPSNSACVTNAVTTLNPPTGFTATAQ